MGAQNERMASSMSPKDQKTAPVGGTNGSSPLNPPAKPFSQQELIALFVQKTEKLAHTERLLNKERELTAHLIDELKKTANYTDELKRRFDLASAPQDNSGALDVTNTMFPSLAELATRYRMLMRDTRESLVASIKRCGAKLGCPESETMIQLRFSECIAVHHNAESHRFRHSIEKAAKFLNISPSPSFYSVVRHLSRSEHKGVLTQEQEQRVMEVIDDNFTKSTRPLPQKIFVSPEYVTIKNRIISFMKEFALLQWQSMMFSPTVYLVCSTERAAQYSECFESPVRNTWEYDGNQKTHLVIIPPLCNDIGAIEKGFVRTIYTTFQERTLAMAPVVETENVAKKVEPVVENPAVVVASPSPSPSASASPNANANAAAK